MDRGGKDKKAAKTQAGLCESEQKDIQTDKLSYLSHLEMNKVNKIMNRCKYDLILV